MCIVYISLFVCLCVFSVFFVVIVALRFSVCISPCFCVCFCVKTKALCLLVSSSVGTAGDSFGGGVSALFFLQLRKNSEKVSVCANTKMIC